MNIQRTLNHYCISTLLGLSLTLATKASGQDVDRSAATRAPQQHSQYLLLNHQPILLYPVLLQEKKLRLVLDTGSSVYALSDEHEAKLGELVSKERISTASGDLKARFFSTPSMSLFGKSLAQDCLTACLPMSLPSEALGCKIDGIVGASFLPNKIVMLDFDHRQLSWESRKDEWSAPPAAVRIPMEREQRKKRFCVDVQVVKTDPPVKCLIDTGSNFDLSVTPKLFARLVSLRRVRGIRERRALSIKEERVVQTGVLDTVEFAGFTINEVHINESRGVKIGLDFLRRFQTWIDANENSLYVVPSNGFLLPPATEKVGLGIEWKRGQVVAYRVDPESPASRAGIAVDDVISRVNNKKVDGSDFPAIKALFRAEAGTRVSVDMIRNDKPYQTTIVLENFEDWPKPNKANQENHAGR